MSLPAPPPSITGAASATDPVVTAVVVLAAGQGTRMRSRTPKVLHELGGRSMLGHVLAAAAPLGAARTAVVVGSGREQVTAHLDAVAPAALAVVQEEQRGSGHAAAVALDALTDVAGPVLIVNGDAPLLRTGTLAGHSARSSELMKRLRNRPGPPWARPFVAGPGLKKRSPS